MARTEALLKSIPGMNYPLSEFPGPGGRRSVIGDCFEGIFLYRGQFNAGSQGTSHHGRMDRGVVLTRLSKSRFFVRGQNFSFEILRKKKCKNHIICVNHETKTVKEVQFKKKMRFAHTNLKILYNVRKILRGCTTVRP